MKVIRFFLLFSIFLCIQKVNGQWMPLNDPEACSPTSIIRISNGILCGTPSGMFLTVDDGITWTEFTTFPYKDIVAMQNFSDTIVVLFCSGFSEENYYDSLFSITSYDGGINWTSPYYMSILYFAELHKYGNTIMANVAEGLYITYDYGITWLNVQLPSGQYYANVVFCDTLFIMFTNDFNFTQYFNYWGYGGSTNIFSYDSLNTIRGKTAIDSVLFGYQMNTGSFYDIVRSTNHGQTWQPVATVNQTTNFQLFEIDNELFYSESNFNFFKSTNLGITWNPAPRPHKIDYKNIVTLTNGDEICSFNNTGKLSHYITPADSSYEIHSGIHGSNISLIQYSNNNLYAGIDWSMYKSTDFGNTWNALSSVFYSDIYFLGDTLFDFGNTPRRSFDSGQNWTVLPTLPQPMVSNYTTVGSRIVISWQQTYYSDDFGDTWILVPDAGPNACSVPFAYYDGNMAGFGNKLYTATYDGIVGEFDFSTHSWTPVYCFPAQPFSNLEAEIFTVGNELMVFYDSILYFSYDGHNWTTSQLNGTPVGIFGKIIPTSIISRNGELAGICGKYGLFHSYNGGLDWFPLLPQPPFLANCITLVNNEIYAGSYFHGTWKSGMILGLSEQERFSDRNSIAYPNPAGDYFKINLPAGEKTSRLLITDQLGRNVIDIPFHSGETGVNTSFLPDGIYSGHILFNNETVNNFRVVIAR